jgi:hypothetical protein
MFCKDETLARRRFQKRAIVTMAVYLALVVCATWLVHHGLVHGWAVYVWSVLPALPVIVVIAQMGRYLKEEIDEYLRLMTMRSLLVATAALLGMLVVSDFLRSYTASGDLPPFVSFMVFCVAFAMAQGVQKLRNLTPEDEGVVDD